MGSFTCANLGNPQKPGKYPELHCKAHDVRMCVSWLADETQRSTDIGYDYGKRRSALAWSQQDCTN
jgi:hypothetical protein